MGNKNKNQQKNMKPETCQVELTKPSEVLETARKLNPDCNDVEALDRYGVTVRQLFIRNPNPDLYCKIIIANEPHKILSEQQRQFERNLLNYN